MRAVNLADAGFLYLEKRQTPMHVGGLSLFTFPQGVNRHRFLGELLEVLRTQEEYRRPFGEFVTSGRAGPLGPLYWEHDTHLDIDYHVRHSALPQPGRYRELFMLVSRLHSSLLDRSRPLWEMHLIEGLQGNQFALYNKTHHAAVDGVSAMHMTNAMYSSKKSARSEHSPLSRATYERYKQSKLKQQAVHVDLKSKEMRTVMEAMRQQFDTTTNLMSAFRRFGGAFFGRSGNLSVPWHQIPHTSINTRVSGSRRFVAQSFAFERVRGVCKAMDGTINDIVLAMCSGALRRYLASQKERPTHSLKAMAPVSLRDDDDLDSSNAVGFITADLATNVFDPEQRIRKIQASMAAGKALLQSMTHAEATLFMQLTQIPVLLTSVLGLAGKFPAFSTVISNVPGPREQLYWNGAALEGIYPASVVFDGFAMNITLVSYKDQLDFGIVACRRSVPQVQRMIDYLEESLQELEEVAGIRTVPGKRRRERTGAPAVKIAGEAGAAASPKTKTITKTKTKAKATARAKTAAPNSTRTKGTAGVKPKHAPPT
ncbi:wax ester/triacylglycerol synthase family O-acyltransferase [Kineobactrum sediminis]|uniref:diacylglycerol O-acyltransferase n=1 Tax=Kineobactrum sediminis TaxID=1905677 RepID=A0A2N5Y4A6_9GAMM|nr:wax ester/triacylglycerol synthase family O-acyltransferase [Kineobactrum sediminis]PLW83208.1 wax ester/triacylglycerol synthase family O-acyltransferase [Kineobactrum sediminis]